MAELSMKEVVRRLESTGVKVVVYKRKDGGLLIKEINGTKFSGAKGNQIARWMVGATISEARKEQTEMATKHRLQYRKGTRRKPKNEISKELKKAQAKVNKLRRKQDKIGGGIATTRHIANVVKEQGEQEALRLLKQQELYVQGLAYTENIEHLKTRIQNLLRITEDQNYQRMLDEIEKYHIQKYSKKGNKIADYYNITDDQVWVINYEILNEIDEGNMDSDAGLSYLIITLKHKSSTKKKK